MIRFISMEEKKLLWIRMPYMDRRFPLYEEQAQRIISAKPWIIFATRRFFGVFP